MRWQKVTSVGPKWEFLPEIDFILVVKHERLKSIKTTAEQFEFRHFFSKSAASTYLST